MINIGVILGSTRPGRNGEAVAQWVMELAKQRRDADFELVEIEDFDAASGDDTSYSQGEYSKENTEKLARKISDLDAFVFVTPEFNNSTPAALKSALDNLYTAWNNKVAGFVGYGTTGGLRAVEQLRVRMPELQIADVRTQVTLKFADDFEDYSKFLPSSPHKQLLYDMIDQLVYWGEAMKKVRSTKTQPA